MSNSVYLHILIHLNDETISYGGQYRVPVGEHLLDFLYYNDNDAKTEVNTHPYFLLTDTKASEMTEKLEKLQSIYRELLEHISSGDTDFDATDMLCQNYFNHYHCIASMHVSLDDAQAMTLDYMTKDFEDCLYIELAELLRRHRILKHCKNCGRLFVAPKGNVDYCQRVFTPDGKTCAQVGYAQTFAKSVKSDELLQAYTRAYKAHYARMTKPRKRAANMTRDDFEQWYKEAKLNLEKARRGEIAAEAFYEWLKI